MTDMGLAEFHQFTDSVDLDRLTTQFKELESRRAQLQQKMVDRNAANRRGLDEQFALLSALVFPKAAPASSRRVASR
jgi:hypothetical protein